MFASRLRVGLRIAPAFGAVHVVSQSHVGRTPTVECKSFKEDCKEFDDKMGAVPKWVRFAGRVVAGVALVSTGGAAALFVVPAYDAAKCVFHSSIDRSDKAKSDAIGAAVGVAAAGVSLGMESAAAEAAKKAAQQASEEAVKQETEETAKQASLQVVHQSSTEAVTQVGVETTKQAIAESGKQGLVEVGKQSVYVGVNQGVVEAGKESGKEMVKENIPEAVQMGVGVGVVAAVVFLGMEVGTVGMVTETISKALVSPGIVCGGAADFQQFPIATMDSSASGAPTSDIPVRGTFIHFPEEVDSGSPRRCSSAPARLHGVQQTNPGSIGHPRCKGPCRFEPHGKCMYGDTCGSCHVTGCQGGPRKPGKEERERSKKRTEDRSVGSMQ